MSDKTSKMKERLQKIAQDAAKKSNDIYAVMNMSAALPDLKQMESVLKYAEGITERLTQEYKNMVNLLDLPDMSEIEKQLAPLMKSAEKFSSAFQYEFKNLAKMSESIIGSVNEIGAGIAIQANYILKKLPESNKYEEKIFKLLGIKGWFIDSAMSTLLPHTIYELYKKGEDGKAEQKLIEYFRYRSKEIISEICSKYPNRENLLSKALIAHQNCEYDVCIPLFLIQVDGLCFDIFNNNYFRKRSGRPILSNNFDELAQNPYFGAIYYAFMENFPISYSFNQRTKEFSELNRHQILHGEITNYGTETNSLKAISLLSYVSYVLDLYEDEKQTDSS